MGIGRALAFVSMIYIGHALITLFLGEGDGDLSLLDELQKGALHSSFPWVRFDYFAAWVSLLSFDISFLRSGVGALYRQVLFVPIGLAIGWAFVSVMLPTLINTGKSLLRIFR